MPGLRPSSFITIIPAATYGRGNITGTSSDNVSFTLNSSFEAFDECSMVRVGSERNDKIMTGNHSL